MGTLIDAPTDYTVGKSKTIKPRVVQAGERRDYSSELNELDARPKHPWQCVGLPGVCPFVGCEFHLYLDVNPNGNIKFNFPHLELWELPAQCALDVAEQGGMTLQDVGDLVNLTRERVRQVETDALKKLKAVGLFIKEDLEGMSDFWEGSATRSNELEIVRRTKVSEEKTDNRFPFVEHDAEATIRPADAKITNQLLKLLESCDRNAVDIGELPYWFVEKVQRFWAETA